MPLLIEKKGNSLLLGLNVELDNHIFPTARTFVVKHETEEFMVVAFKIWDEDNIFGTHGHTEMAVFYFDKNKNKFKYGGVDSSWKNRDKNNENYADNFIFFCNKIKPAPEYLLQIYEKFILRHFFDKNEIKYHQTQDDIFKLNKAIMLDNELRKLMKNTLYRKKGN